MAATPEQFFWRDLDRLMGNMWLAQRHEDKYQPDIPDVSYVCRRMVGWLELKVVSDPQRYAPFQLSDRHFTPGQRNWLKSRGEAGNGLCFVLIRIRQQPYRKLTQDEHLLLRWDRLPLLGSYTLQDFREDDMPGLLWFSAGSFPIMKFIAVITDKPR